MAKERKVVYSLEVVEGDGNKQAFANTEAGIKAATAALKEHTAARKEYDRTNAASAKRGGRAGGSGSSFADGMAKAELNAIKQAAADERRERERNIADMQRAAQREKQILADRVRANVEANRAITQSARAANADSWRRRGNMAPSSAFQPTDGFSDADAKRAVEDLGRAHTVAEREAAKHHAQQMKVLGGYVQIGGGIMQAARAAIFFGATNEDNAQKMLKMVLIGESLVSTFSAVKNIAGGLGKVLGTGGIGGMAGGGIGGMLAGGGLAAGGALAGKAAGIAAIAGAGMMGLDAIRSRIRGENVGSNLRDGSRVVTDWIGLTDSVGDNQRDMLGRLGRAENRTMGDGLRPRLNSLAQNHRGGLDRAETLAGIMAGGPGMGGQLAAVQAKQSLAAKELTQAGTRWNLPELNGADGLLARQGVGQRELEAAERMVRLTTERHQIELQINRDSIEGSRQRIRNLEQERDIRMGYLTAGAADRRRGAENFAAMSKADQAQVLAAQKIVDTGNLKALSPKQVELFAQANPSLGRSIQQETALVNARAGGFGALEKDMLGYERQVAKGINNLTAKITTEATLKVSLEMNEQQLVDKFKTAIVPLFDLIEANSKRLFGLEEGIMKLKRQQEMRSVPAS